MQAHHSITQTLWSNVIISSSRLHVGVSYVSGGMPQSLEGSVLCPSDRFNVP